MTPVVIIVLLLSVTAVSPVPISESNRQKREVTSTFAKIVKANENVSPKSQRRTIIEALTEFERGNHMTCIRFVKKTKEDVNYISFISGTGCWSYLGRQGNAQPISLQKNGCVSKDIVQHEALHALGFHHEHVRSDRDEHVIINFENIISGFESNFEIVQTNNLGTTYDFLSVMHYGEFDFSRNGRPTIVARDSAVTTFGTATEMSANDYERVNRLYDC
ncbi:low choriolytic enzyme-like isoform X3 [Hippocampus zosterae]|uniref:low choriolytic enzyme-like isoform X3 n=1 Tax=Hippocampus zosterae TaxID=109293 RepID=UPI00223DEFD0|nr:low choriolytic enzyme-like isoform X3 [Hippocampus zosterae]